MKLPKAGAANEVRQFGTVYVKGEAVRFVKCRACYDQ